MVLIGSMAAVRVVVCRQSGTVLVAIMASHLDDWKALFLVVLLPRHDSRGYHEPVVT